MMLRVGKRPDRIDVIGRWIGGRLVRIEEEERGSRVLTVRIDILSSEVEGFSWEELLLATERRSVGEPVEAGADILLAMTYLEWPISDETVTAKAVMRSKEDGVRCPEKKVGGGGDGGMKWR
jgi:hypothetical protein